jgi:ABC-type maltose transport system permease subunit
LSGLSHVFEISNFVSLFIGVFMGIVFGALPGLTATMGLALLVPFTFTIGSKTANLPVLLNRFSGDTSLASWNAVAALGLFQLIPIMIFFIFTQEMLLNIYSGGAKGGT